MGNELSAETKEDGDEQPFTKHYERLTKMLKDACETMVNLNNDIENLVYDSNECHSSLETSNGYIDEEDAELQAEIDAEVHRFPNRLKAEMYVTLSRKFPEKNRVDKEEAVAQCNSLDMAEAFLNRECELCTETFPETKMTSMMSCEHTCCDTCAAEYYNIQIRERPISEAKCPFCDEPKEEGGLTDHYAWLAQKLVVLYERGLIQEEVVKLFGRKVTQNTLEKDPLFRWCGQCPNGMIIENVCQKKMKCDSCKKMSCVDCQQPWQKQHETLTCEEFAQWKHDNDPKFQALCVEKQLQAEGIQCPNCKRRYFLARGGCLHFTCHNCKFEFCSGCSNQFSRGANCLQGGAACRNNGFHAHHPKNCFYYLRDREIPELEQILERNNVQYQNMPKKNQGRVCKVLEQKDTVNGLKDEECGNPKYKQTGLCGTHYAEQLCLLLNRHRIEV